MQLDRLGQYSGTVLIASCPYLSISNRLDIQAYLAKDRRRALRVAGVKLCVYARNPFVFIMLLIIIETFSSFYVWPRSVLGIVMCCSVVSSSSSSYLTYSKRK
jgi:hypothetical protein